MGQTGPRNRRAGIQLIHDFHMETLSFYFSTPSPDRRSAPTDLVPIAVFPETPHPLSSAICSGLYRFCLFTAFLSTIFKLFNLAESPLLEGFKSITRPLTINADYSTKVSIQFTHFAFTCIDKSLSSNGFNQLQSTHQLGFRRHRCLSSSLIFSLSVQSVFALLFPQPTCKYHR